MMTYVPRPVINSMNGTMGHLSQLQQLIVKVCSCCGDTFNFSMLKAVYPLPIDPHMLVRELFQIARLGIFETSSESTSGEVIITFRSIMLMEVAYSVVSGWIYVFI
jgi:hypothetical protein